jgi:hypothetical protein
MEQPQIISRADAKAQGLKHYFTGKPCKRGHLSVRYVCSAECQDCLFAKNKQWQHNNPGRYLELQREASARWRRENPEAAVKQRIAWVEKNPERAIECARERRRRWKTRHPQKSADVNKAWREKNKAHHKALIREWERRNPDRVSLKSRRRQTRLRISAFDHEREDIRVFYVGCPEGYHVDHIVPLKHPLVCGLHVISNLQYLTASDNSRKSNTWEPDW